MAAELPAGQPVHTVFGGAHLFRAGVAERFGVLAIESIDTFASTADELAQALGLRAESRPDVVYARIREKLQRAPVEDYRIDFEDGYGVRADDEEDAHAIAAANELASGVAAGLLPASIGIRLKGVNDAERPRAVRTLRLVLSTLLAKSDTLPAGFVINIPKIATLADIERTVEILALAEREFSLDVGALKFEVMIETPSIVLGADGRSPLPLLAVTGGERLVGAIFGAYDYTGALGIAAAYQGLRHSACDFARQVMLAGLAGTTLRLSDGATATIPIAVHRAEAGAALTAAQTDENRRSVHAAWKVHYDNTRHAMANGFYQGWDLHPAQLVSRYAATYAFYLEGLEAATIRYRNFLAKNERATRVGAAFDDAATARGLENYFARALSCGAITKEEWHAHVAIHRIAPHQSPQ